jgi:hypothetical protein
MNMPVGIDLPVNMPHHFYDDCLFAATCLGFGISGVVRASSDAQQPVARERQPPASPFR